MSQTVKQCFFVFANCEHTYQLSMHAYNLSSSECTAHCAYVCVCVCAISRRVGECTSATATCPFGRFVVCFCVRLKSCGWRPGGTRVCYLTPCRRVQLCESDRTVESFSRSVCIRVRLKSCGWRPGGTPKLFDPFYVYRIFFLASCTSCSSSRGRRLCSTRHPSY